MGEQGTSLSSLTACNFTLSYIPADTLPLSLTCSGPPLGCLSICECGSAKLESQLKDHSKRVSGVLQIEGTIRGEASRQFVSPGSEAGRCLAPFSGLVTAGSGGTRHLTSRSTQEVRLSHWDGDQL